MQDNFQHKFTLSFLLHLPYFIGRLYGNLDEYELTEIQSLLKTLEQNDFDYESTKGLYRFFKHTIEKKEFPLPLDKINNANFSTEMLISKSYAKGLCAIAHTTIELNQTMTSFEDQERYPDPD